MRLIGLALAAILVISMICNSALATEYKTYDNDYFSVEYPAEWNPKKIEGTYTGCAFFSPDADGKMFGHQVISVRVGSNGIDIQLNQNYKDLTATGNLSDEILHFLNTFRSKR